MNSCEILKVDVFFFQFSISIVAIGYTATATATAAGGQGLYMRSLHHLGRSSGPKIIKTTFHISSLCHYEHCRYGKGYSCIYIWNLKHLHTPWVLHIAKFAYFFSSSLPNVEWAILGPLPFFFYQKLFIFGFLENCFWEPNLYIAVG